MRSFFLWGLTALPALAQVGEISVSLGASTFQNENLGRQAPDDPTYVKIDGGFRMGARFTLNTKKFIGHEFGYGYTRSKLALSDDSANATTTTHQGMYNFLLYATPEGARIRPFVTGGGQFSTFYPPGSSVGYGNGVTKFGFNYGAGLKLRLTPVWAIRLDVRDYVMPKPDLGVNIYDRSGSLRLLEVSAGFGFYF